MKSYQVACDYRDRPTQTQDIELAIQQFQDLQSFDGFYAIGEMFLYGINKPFNGNPIRLDSNEEKAAEYFLKAYEAYQNESKESPEKSSSPRLKVKVDGKEIPSALPEDVKAINELLNTAKKGNPELLFQLACTYIRELKVFNEEKQRKLSVFSKSQLVLWIKSCLEAAAQLDHPHAAYLLVTEFANHELLSKKDHLSPQDKLKYSLIAADPIAAKQNSSGATQFMLRGERPLTNPIELNTCGAMPEALYSRQAIALNTKMSGIFETSASTRGDCILPLEHKEFQPSGVAQTVGSSGPSSPLSRAELAAKRAAMYTIRKV
ncbi:MAG: hypothetical protein ACYCQI_03875 [Gammaproteobacteria bacterium]